jgi:hypothetical protein
VSGPLGGWVKIGVAVATLPRCRRGVEEASLSTPRKKTICWWWSGRRTAKAVCIGLLFPFCSSCDMGMLYFA